MLNGVVVIPRGSPASGEITRVKRKGMWGRSGRLETRLLSVRAHGMNIPISGTVAERGETGTAAVVASIVVLPVAGFFVTGTSAIMPVGRGSTVRRPRTFRSRSTRRSRRPQLPAQAANAPQ
ncbi:MAG: hypothetical protein QOD42_1979 [Sphingomonadales bacterium]|nr:hypothetical protein [Sphingomonadales bacterium]